MNYKFYGENLVNRARRLRRKGIGCREIGEKLRVSSSTISIWTRDIGIDNPWYLKARNREQKFKENYQNIFNGIKINKNFAKLFASLLYWCEGSKYPFSNTLTFCNSDERLVKTFLSLIRRGFDLDESKFRVHLQLHTTHNKEKVYKYWSNLLNIPETQFYKPTVTKPTKVMKRRNYMGTCTIKYFDVKLLLGIIGLYEKMIEKIK